MNKFLSRIALALLACALLGSVALAGVKTKQITLPQDVMINGTMLKQGTYKMKFDDQTGELSFIKDKATVAKTNARMEQRRSAPRFIEFGIDTQGESKLLRSITFAGDKQKLVLVDENK